MSTITPPQRFCPHCGSSVSIAARFCGSCGRTLVVSDSDETIVSRHSPSRPTPSQTQMPLPPTPPKRRRGWLPVLVMALAAVCCLGVLGVGGLFGLRGGWTLPGISNPSPAQLNLEPLLSETLQPSGQSQTVTWNDQVAVTIPGDLLPSAQTLSISAVSNAPPPLAADIYTPGALYDVSLGNLTRFTQPLTVELAYDPTSLSPDLPAADQLAVAYWEPDRQEWVFGAVTVLEKCMGDEFFPSSAFSTD